MASSDTITIPITLPFDEAQALAQFVKRRLRHLLPVRRGLLHLRASVRRRRDVVRHLPPTTRAGHSRLQSAMRGGADHACPNQT
jgi:hypothetical protein